MSLAADGRATLSTSAFHPFGENMRVAEGIEVLEFHGSEHADQVHGGARDDVISGGAGNDMLRGYAGNDIIDGGEGDDVIYADVLVNHISGPGSADVLKGSGGDDIIHANMEFASIDGGEGFDTAVISAAPEQGDAVIDVRSFGTVGARISNIDSFHLLGSHGDDILTGGRKVDILTGGAGDDTLRGGYNDDRLFGGEGDDLLDGEDGDDWLEGGTGRDTYIGGAGDDTLHVHDLGFASIDGGEGFDTLMIAPQQQAGHYAIDASAGTISTGATFSGIDSLYLYETWSSGYSRASYDIIGTDNADATSFSATTGTIRFEARGGDDRLSGGGQDDVLDGGDGDDWLKGNGGDDTLTGGAGADAFVFESTWSQGQDVVTDFDAAEGDTISFIPNRSSAVTSYEDFMSGASETGGGVLVELYQPGILSTAFFEGASLEDFTPDNVLFA